MGKGDYMVEKPSTINCSSSDYQDKMGYLRGDCESCFGLCCVALCFSASQGFAFDKAAGLPCAHLLPDFRCGVHSQLAPLGLHGCMAFDCFGAGQKVSQKYSGRRDWSNSPVDSQQMFDLFLIMRQLQEMMLYLNEALVWETTASIHDKLFSMIDRVERLTASDPNELMELDVEQLRASEIKPLLLKASKRVRKEFTRELNNLQLTKRFRPNCDLSSADLRGVSLTGLNLRSSCLIAADLRDTDLSGTDLLGADLRDADIRGANLARSLFVNNIQLRGAKGDATTTIPPHLERPANWKR